MEIEARPATNKYSSLCMRWVQHGKTYCRGRNVIEQWATVDVSSQRGANVIMCTALSNDGLLLYKHLIGPNNPEKLILVLDDLYNLPVPVGETGQRASNTTFVAV